MNWLSHLRPQHPHLLCPGAVSPDVVIAGLAIDLPDGWNDDAKRTIKDATETIATATGPFEDNLRISQLRDGEEDGIVELGDD